MGEKRTSLEVIAPTVEEAVEKGLAELGLREDDVDIEVFDQGSRGLFGLGSRQARVRLTIKSLNGAVFSDENVFEEVEEPITEEIEPELEIHDGYSDIEPELALIAEEKPIDEQQETMLRVAREVVQDLLVKMKVRAQVKARYVEPEDEHSRAQVWVDVRGNDLSILIGPRAETLNALQYIASLITSKEVGHTLPLIVDVEGFRARRVQQLRQLAQRMADQAVKTGRRQVLEPMPANERRIIHIELRNNPQVMTESVGEEPRRKVTIIPK